MEIHLEHVVEIAQQFAAFDSDLQEAIDFIAVCAPDPDDLTLEELDDLSRAGYADIEGFFMVAAGRGCAEAEEAIELVRRIRAHDNEATRLRLAHQGAPRPQRFTVITRKGQAGAVKALMILAGFRADPFVATGDTAMFEIYGAEGVYIGTIERVIRKMGYGDTARVIRWSEEEAA